MSNIPPPFDPELGYERAKEAIENMSPMFERPRTDAPYTDDDGPEFIPDSLAAMIGWPRPLE